jgi:hypothetical protein
MAKKITFSSTDDIKEFYRNDPPITISKFNDEQEPELQLTDDQEIMEADMVYDENNIEINYFSNAIVFANETSSDDSDDEESFYDLQEKYMLDVMRTRFYPLIDNNLSGDVSSAKFFFDDSK